MTPEIQWQPLIELIVVMMTILGSTIPLYLHLSSSTDAKIDAMRAEAKEFSNAVLSEMKDFHGRLCAIEERNKGK